MMHKAWRSIEEVPYCFSRSSIKFHGHTGEKIDGFNPIWDYLAGRSYQIPQICLVIFTDAVTGIFRKSYIKILAPHITSPSAAMVLTMQDKHVLVLAKERFQLLMQSQFWEIIENANLYFLRSRWQGVNSCGCNEEVMLNLYALWS